MKLLPCTTPSLIETKIPPNKKCIAHVCDAVVHLAPELSITSPTQPFRLNSKNVSSALCMGGRNKKPISISAQCSWACHTLQLIQWPDVSQSLSKKWECVAGWLDHAANLRDRHTHTHLSLRANRYPAEPNLGESGLLQKANELFVCLLCVYARAEWAKRVIKCWPRYDNGLFVCVAGADEAEAVMRALLWLLLALCSGKP